MEANDTMPKRKRKLGKLTFIAVLSIWLANFFHSSSLQSYNESLTLTFDEYVKNFDKYKEAATKAPESLGIYILALLILFLVIFALYEVSGMVFEWLQNRYFTPYQWPDEKQQVCTDLPLPIRLREKVEKELQNEEKVEWLDRPVPRFFSPKATAAFVFSLPWTAFALFWTFGVSGPNGSNPMAIFGTPFILIGFCMLSSPLLAYIKSLKTVYVITDRRAITFDGGFASTIRSYYPNMLGEVYRKEKKSGIGDVIISQKKWLDSDDNQRIEEIGFIHIKSPKQAEDLLKELWQKDS